MEENISALEQEDIQAALDAGRFIGSENSRRVLSQTEIDKIVDVAVITSYQGMGEILSKE